MGIKKEILESTIFSYQDVFKVAFNKGKTHKENNYNDV